MTAQPLPYGPHRFTSDEARRGQANGIAKKQQKTLEAAQKRHVVDRLTEHLDTAQIGQQAFQTAITIMEKLQNAAATIEIADAKDAAKMSEVTKVLHGIYRLETGQSTSNTASLAVNVTQEELDAKRAELRARLDAE